MYCQAYHAPFLSCSCVRCIIRKGYAKPFKNCHIRFCYSYAILLTKRKCLAIITIILAIVSNNSKLQKELIHIMVSLVSELRLFFLSEEGNDPKLSLERLLF